MVEIVKLVSKNFQRTPLWSRPRLPWYRTARCCINHAVIPFIIIRLEHNFWRSLSRIFRGGLFRRGTFRCRNRCGCGTFFFTSHLPICSLRSFLILYYLWKERTLEKVKFVRETIKRETIWNEISKRLNFPENGVLSPTGLISLSIYARR